MNIDLIHFTPWASLAGGAVIGLAAAVFVLGDGRIAGIAGIVGGTLQSLVNRVRHGPPREPQALDGAVRAAFIAGLLAAPWLWQAVAPLPAARVGAGLPVLLLAGLLVGVGVRMGNGCTSGHGVCGLARGSRRSAVNVLAFMAAGAAVVFVMRHFAAAA